MKSILKIAICLCIGVYASAQGVTEAVRYSTTSPIGTARVVGVGGSFGSLGGDLGVLAINPAGIADYRKSEFTISPTFSTVRSDAGFTNLETTNTDESNSILSINNIGVVFSYKPKSSSLNTSNLAISLNRNNSFRQNIFYEGSTITSITDRFLERANGNATTDLDDFEAYPAYATDAIYDLDNDGFYDSDFSVLPGSDTRLIDKSQSIKREGRNNELNIAWAGKYNESLNIGIGVGIPIISFEERKTYNESDNDNLIENFNNLTYQENITTSATGINLKFGAQYAFAKIMRVGASLQSPSWMSVTDDYETYMKYDFTLNNVQYVNDYESPAGNFKYRLNTPWKATVSAATIIRAGKINGFINGDVEFIDYRNTDLNFSAFGNSGETIAETEANEQINLQLASTINYRLGGELAYKKVRVRGGLQLQSSPYDLDGGDLNPTTSVGLGYRGDKIFIDLAYRSSQSEEGYVPYILLDETRNQVVNIKNNTSNLFVTIGFKF